ncbi:hypothetical protein GCM10009007_03470 [Formosimonas limnophila]|uniref:Cyanophage baseplate Pam3 plug gp18 domain-containing protein n=1 Tax=Formosimonas limnophila TaxID=1384487 RepID=A0A8J3FYJ0_9BURK|nr:hypothetical protein [Formosimonas limnophila]GHA66307.1 hypothetical protein GCM10009007_03470 [Formosimonas limnophila]
MSSFQYIEVTPDFCQSFVVGEYKVRLNYNYLVNYWTYSLYHEEKPIVCGVRLMVGTNIFERVENVNDLVVVDTVGQPRHDWFYRLTKKNRSGIPDTVLVYGSANP